jgi:hypothetical protein
MRASPSIVPGGIDRDVYLVLDDFGRGCAWRETNVEDTDLEAVINDLLEGQYKNPVCVIGFNVSEGWVRDVSEDVARTRRQRCADEDRELPDSLQQLVEQAAGTLAARMPIRVINHEVVPQTGSFEVRFSDRRPILFFYWTTFLRAGLVQQMVLTSPRIKQPRYSKVISQSRPAAN